MQRKKIDHLQLGVVIT